MHRKTCERQYLDNIFDLILICCSFAKTEKILQISFKSLLKTTKWIIVAELIIVISDQTVCTRPGIDRNQLKYLDHKGLVSMLIPIKSGEGLNKKY